MGSGRAGFALRRFASGSFDTAIEVDRAHMSSKHQLFIWGLLNKFWAVQLHSLHSGRLCYSLPRCFRSHLECQSDEKAEGVNHLFMKGRQKKENKKFKIHSYSVEVGPNLLLISFAFCVDFFLLVPSCGRFSPLVPLGLLRPHIPVVPFVFLLSFFFFLLFCFFCFFLLLLLLLLLVLLLLLSSLFSASLCSYCCWRPDVDGAFVKLLQIVRLGGRRPLQLQDIIADYKLFGDDTLFLPGKKTASRFFPSYHMIENSDVFLRFFTVKQVLLSS